MAKKIDNDYVKALQFLDKSPQNQKKSVDFQAIDELLARRYRSAIQSIILRTKELELEQRETVLDFVKNYLIVSSIVVLNLIVFLMAMNIVLIALDIDTDIEIIETWSLRIIVGSSITQFIYILHSISKSLFGKPKEK